MNVDGALADDFADLVAEVDHRAVACPPLAGEADTPPGLVAPQAMSASLASARMNWPQLRSAQGGQLFGESGLHLRVMICSGWREAQPR